jgi:hypothetical protein
MLVPVNFVSQGWASAQRFYGVQCNLSCLSGIHFALGLFMAPCCFQSTRSLLEAGLMY